MDGGAWQAAVHGVATSRTWLSDFTFTFHFHALEKEMATHSSVLAWRIPGMGEPGGLPFMGSHRVGHDWSDLPAAAVAAVFLPEEFHGQMSLAGYHPCSCKESDMMEWLSKQAMTITLVTRPTIGCCIWKLILTGPFNQVSEGFSNRQYRTIK